MRSVVQTLHENDQQQTCGASAPNELCDEIISFCKDDLQRRIISMRLDGNSTQEIAEQLGCKLRKVQLAIKDVQDRYLPWHQFLSA
jgi:DNA-directed RNA polymerase specialized sigma24 family protein